MATNNITFPIYNADGTPFNGLVLRNATFDSVVMSLGDKITGDVYYKDNTLAVTMSEYIEYKRNEDSEVVKFILVNPPTVVREGVVSDNSELRGMTKYSFVFYHPMCVVSNFPFTDVAVSLDEQKYLSNSKTFNWIGNLFDMVAKLNKNLQGTQWVVGTNIEHYEQDGVTETSMWQKAAKIPDEPLSFDKTYVSEVLKTSYETWEIPFVVDQIAPTDASYAQGKRFLILFGTPSNEILDDQGEPYIFRFGQGVGLKNNSRTPKNNKIVTRIVGYGSENNIPFGYPQIQWYGDQTWKYTVNNDLSAVGSLPIYKGILGGQYVNLIKHPFTRKTLMPSVYRETLFNKVSPYMPDGTLNQNFDPTIELVDYYDADSSYVNPIVQGAESVEIHQFEDIKPEFTEHSIVGISAYDGIECISISEFNTFIQAKILASNNENEKSALQNVYDNMFGMVDSISNIGGSYTFLCKYGEETEYTNGVWQSVKYTSSGVSFTYNVYNGSQPPSVDVEWDDTMDDDGNYKQSYFKMTLPQLDFDLYACASITEEMKINMRSGACIGCTFPIYVDWDDYKANFYDSNGNFLPDGEQRNLTKYPKTNLGQVAFVVKKDLDTFGTLMPNTYQKPHSGDEFVILGISLPTTYVTNAEARLDDAAKEYMRENNVHYYEYPLKFDEHFLATHTNILSQIRNNTIVHFQYGGELPMALYVKQMTVKYSGVLPTYDITLTDDVEIVLNQIGQVTDDVSRMRVQVSELQKYYSENIIQAINEKLSKVVDDVCQGRITFQAGLDALGSVLLSDEIRSSDFSSGLYAGRGWRIDELGNAELESVRVRSYLEIVQLIINRMQAQEGDTLYTDNDQIDKVEEKTHNGTTYYKLSLKEKWGGYVTSQKVDNILRGVINTLAAKEGRVSDVTEGQSVETDGDNKFYTSWMKVINPSSVGDTVETNQICVLLYGDDYTDPITGEVVHITPAGKNFKPCELMTIARWGCDAEPEASGLTPAQKADIERRQRIFSISTTDGRIAKLRGVRRPILEPANYGTTLGIVPDFINQWSIASRLKKGRDYLYAQGVIVGDFIKVNDNGDPLTNYVDCGDWQDNTPYLHEAYNSTTLQWETSDVWHNGSYWRCKVTQPYQGTYYEPTEANSLFWEKLLKSGDDGKTITTKLTIPTLNIPCDASGNSKAGGSKDCYVTMYVDGTAVQTSEMTLTVISKPTSITVKTYADVSQISKNRLYIIYPANVARNNLEGNILFSISDGTNTTYSSIAVTCSNDGQQGAQGKTGRFFFYGKEFNTSNTDTFSATDTEAPFFYYNSNYWLYKGENFSNKTITQIQSAYGAPSNSNDNWEIMVSDFKYLITEAIFGDYAHFGSAIINGDWMISQHGTYGGNTPIDYTKFDPAYPSTSVYTNHTVNGTTWLGYNFVPNYAVDLLTGKTYMTSAEVRGTIRADNLYHGITFASRAWDGRNVYTSYKWYCMPASIYGDDGYDAKETQQPYYNNFIPCNYYTEEEIATLSGGALTVPQNHGFLMCVGDNDNVYVLPDTYNRFPTIYLPAPEDVPGKVIDVFGFHYGSQSIPNFVVKNVGNPNRGMTSLIYYNSSENRWEAYEASGTAQATVATNAAMRFISTSVTVGSTTTWWWLSVPFYQKEWVQS